MAAVILSSKYQVVIPPSVREAFRLTPGQKMEVMIYQGHITLVPVNYTTDIRGIARGIDTRVPRDADRV